MDLSPEQYFRPQHYAAFDPPKPDLDGDDEPARGERLRVKNALMWLGDQIEPWIQQRNPAWDLHCHRQKEHYVSSFHFVPGYVSRITSMWLHFGKSVEQLDYFRTMTSSTRKHRDEHDDEYNAFYKHTRIQVYINNSIVRCWLLLATDNNIYDRDVYRRKINDPGYFQKLWDLLQPLLNKEFFYEIGGEAYHLDSSADPQTLLEFVRKDRKGLYSGIVKEYQANDPRISSSNILPEMQNGFELLYPIYDHMAYRPQR